MATLEEFMKFMSNRPTSASRSREFDHKAAPQSNAVSDGLAQWMQGVKERTLHPLEAMAKYSQSFQNMTPVDQGMQMIGGGMAGTFIGKGAKTWKSAMQETAEKLEKQGVDPREIYKQTGTFKGADKQWRQEIPDNASQLRMMPRATQMLEARTLDDFMEHPGLLNSYPDLAKTDIRLSSSNNSKGAYLPDSNTIELAGLSETAPYSMAGEVKSTALHETQHAIQQREGWARGGSPRAPYSSGARDIMIGEQFEKLKANNIYKPDNPYSSPDNLLGVDELMKMAIRNTDELGGTVRHDYYKRLAGEAEARLTQSRINMTGAERAASYPPDMFDVPMNQQIVRFGH